MLTGSIYLINRESSIIYTLSSNNSTDTFAVLLNNTKMVKVSYFFVFEF